MLNNANRYRVSGRYSARQIFPVSPELLTRMEPETETKTRPLWMQITGSVGVAIVTSGWLFAMCFIGRPGA